jgi:DMSO reductase anchor subunit
VGALPADGSAFLAAWGPFLSQWGALGSSMGFRIALGLTALVAVHCSAMVYRDTPRALWATRVTSGKFFLSGLLTGTAGLLLLITCFDVFQLYGTNGTTGAMGVIGAPGPFAATLENLVMGLIIALPFAIIAKLGSEAGVHRHLDDQDATPLKKAALLLRGDLRAAHLWRFNTGLVGGFLLPVLWLYNGYAGAGLPDFFFAAAVMILVLAGECLERYLFFTACVPPRMPGA